MANLKIVWHPRAEIDQVNRKHLQQDQERGKRKQEAEGLVQNDSKE